MPELKRKLTSPPKGPDGLYVQPREVGPEREVVENHNRHRAAEHGHYADPWTGNTRTFDPKGNYACGACNMAEGQLCVLLEPKGVLKQQRGGVGPIDLRAGSCEHWEDQCAGDPELVINRIEGEYGVAQNGVGFGCHRCPYAQKAYAADSKGRDLYCRFWECRVLANACCEYNDAPVVSQSASARVPNPKDLLVKRLLSQ